MKKLALALFASAVCLYAADFWNKIFTDWTDKEVQKMVESSPWSKKVDIATGGGGGASIVDSFRTGIGDVKTPNGAGANAQAESFTLYVRWQSALPVRQAFARVKYGDQVTTSPEAQASLTTPDPNYVVVVEGLDRKTAGGDPDSVKHALLEQTALVIKGKEPIRPIDIRLTVQPKISFAFLFPKTTPITMADKEIEFQTKFSTLSVKQKFHLSDMVYFGKLEL